MWNRLKVGGGIALAVGVVLWVVLGGETQARNHYPKKPPPKIDTPPPGTTTGGGCCGGGCDHGAGGGCSGGGCGGGGGGTPPGSTQNAPEPATLVSGLIGLGIAGFYSIRRRKKQAAAE